MPVPERSAVQSPTLLTASELADLLKISRCQVDRMVVEGLPYLDLSIGRPGRRRKRTLRVAQADVMAWLTARGGRS